MTITKAKGARPHVEKLITLGKKGDLHSRCLALSYLQTRKAVSRLFETVAPRYGDRAGGYLRIVRTGFQTGDGAEKAMSENLHQTAATPTPSLSGSPLSLRRRRGLCCVRRSF